MSKRIGEARRQFKHGRRRSSKGVALLAEEDVVVFPVLGDRKALMQPAVLVGLCKEPRSVHEVLSSEEACNLLVPERDVSFTIVDDGTQDLVGLQVSHERVHTLDAVVQVDDALLGVLLVERLDRIEDGLVQDRGQALAHGLVGKGEGMVASERWPGWLIGVYPRRSSDGLELGALRRQVSQVEDGARGRLSRRM